MSLFGAMTTAISGLGAQSRALGHVSNNLANSQTIGYKRIDTQFTELLTQSGRNAHSPGAVQARPDFTNAVQGTIEQSDIPLALAIGGQGFFSVAARRGTVGGLPQFDERQFFTRAGDFQMDRDGFLVNGAGYYLQAWPVADGATEPDRTVLRPVRISQQVFNPIATSRIELAANLPADGIAPVATQVRLYDAMGRAHVANLTFTPVTLPGPPVTPTSQWDLAIDIPSETTPTTRTVRLQFGTTATPPVTPGTLGGFTTPVNLTPGPTALGDPAELTLTTDLGQGPQTITLNLGEIGIARGLTQFAGNEFSVRNLAQNGVPPGSYAGLSIGETGDISINYDNGQSRVVARIPLVTFSDPDALQRLDGQAFMRTIESGEARVTEVGKDGAGRLVVGSIERSNVDIASEFTKLIVAQRAYTANTRVVTASDEMLQETINMRR
ncbi:MAG: flagellar hook protein FlgE [Rhodovarius sp.]|nr:flagellar hook protein FlgE [Rhodovarius sp.]MCX7932090.1 flagellar hook protein FlgE [Rhodovarius sp.]